MKRIACFSAWLAGIVSVPAGEPAFESHIPSAPPPAAAWFTAGTGRTPIHSLATTYSIGDPSPDEQVYLELINRARANPPAEGVILANLKDPSVLGAYDYFQVDLSLMQSQFAVIGPVQPLAFNPKLAAAALRHSLDMFNNVFQDHTGSDGSDPSNRVADAGYAGSGGENIFANTTSPVDGHAGFEVDWGPGVGGMQSPPGHRQTIHNGLFREVGIAIVNGRNSAPGKVPIDEVGPQVVTQDFGNAQNSTPFITGVAYYDLNGNKFYDAGEGIGNVQVTVTGANFQGVSARSGGYAVPVPGNGSYTVTFSGAGFAPVTQTVSIVGSKNSKLDFVPTYTPPIVIGPVVASVGRDNVYSISSVAGANAYEGRSFQKVVAAPEGAENDSAHLTVTQIGAYDVFQSIVVKSGSFAFHLCHPPGVQAEAQYITMSPTYLVNQNASLNFQSMLGLATSDEHAEVHVSTDGGIHWDVAYSQDGNPKNPEMTWQQRTISLSKYNGKIIRIRLAFTVTGSYAVSTDLNVGWLLDDIQFANLQEVVNSQILTTTGNTFQFRPEVIGDFCLLARAKTGHDFLEWGPAVAVRSTPASGAAELNLGLNQETGGPLQFDVNVTSGATPSKLTLESRDSLNSAWQGETVTFQSISSSQFRVTVTPQTSVKTKFYRVRGE